MDFIKQKYNKKEIIKNDFVHSVLEHKNKVLFVGINPSARGSISDKGYHFSKTKNDKKYWLKLWNITEELKISDCTDYTDLFYVRETEQKKLGDYFKDKETTF